MDGFAATSAIRALEQKRGAGRVPIVALTACALTGDRDACLACGMDDYMSKPLRLDLLREVVQRWVPQAAETASASPL